jgi:hypothetical protein
MARLHPETVTNTDKHLKKKPRKKPSVRKVDIKKIDPRVKAELTRMGFKLSDRRVEVITLSEVIIHNHPR